MRPKRAFPSLLVGSLLACAIAWVPACGSGGGGGGGGVGQFRLTATNVTPNQVWEINRRIVFTFNKPVNPASVSFNSISFAGSNTVPVTGSFFVDPCSGGRSVVFQPACPLTGDVTQGGLVPAVTYTVNVPSGNTPTVLRSTDGDFLAQGTTFGFRAPIPGIEPVFIDPNPAPPTPSASVSSPFGLNLFTEPAAPIVVTFDQSLDPAAGNVDEAHFVLEYEDPPGSGTWVEIPRTVALTQNCEVDLGSAACPRPELATVTVVPQGILPPNATCRVVVAAGVKDIGQVQAVASDTVVATFTVDSAGAGGEFDAFVEEFETRENEDTSEAFAVPFAQWGPPSFGGPENLTAPTPFPGADTTFDWTVVGSIVVDTTFAVITNTLGQQLQVTGGVVNIRNFTVSPGAKVFGQGPNPLVINATGNVLIAGEVNVDGFNAVNTGASTPRSSPSPGRRGTAEAAREGRALPRRPSRARREGTASARSRTSLRPAAGREATPASERARPSLAAAGEAGAALSLSSSRRETSLQIPIPPAAESR